jgi:hypothetical protein
LLRKVSHGRGGHTTPWNEEPGGSRPAPCAAAPLVCTIPRRTWTGSCRPWSRRSHESNRGVRQAWRAARRRVRLRRRLHRWASGRHPAHSASRRLPFVERLRRVRELAVLAPVRARTPPADGAAARSPGAPPGPFDEGQAYPRVRSQKRSISYRVLPMTRGR